MELIAVLWMEACELFLGDGEFSEVEWPRDDDPVAGLLIGLAAPGAHEEAGGAGGNEDEGNYDGFRRMRR
jgi:hypothetical protein